MIDMIRAEAMLRRRYPRLAEIDNGLFRAEDSYKNRSYAVKYFDLRDRIESVAASIKDYQEEILGASYYSSETPIDLRWNYYLYFVTSNRVGDSPNFSRAKDTIEADREFARKYIVEERDLDGLLSISDNDPSDELPIDLATAWQERLSDYQLDFVLDEQITAPEVVRRISTGYRNRAGKIVESAAPLAGEIAAAKSFVSKISLEQFRPKPELRELEFGTVNLITGSNGTGKTSLLEAIEFLYCGSHKRCRNWPNASIHAVLQNGNEAFHSTRSPDRLRARNLQWYGVPELKTVNIADSFGKFNLLDTDAATELSVESSSERIGKDVSKIVLGAQSEVISDRLRRVMEKLKEEIRTLENERNGLRKVLDSKSKRIEEIESETKVSDLLAEELAISLSRLGWRKVDTNGKPDVPSYRSNLLFAREEAAKARLLGDNALVLSEDEIEGAEEIRVSKVLAARTLKSETDRLRMEVSRLEQEVGRRIREKEILDSLEAYVAADFTDLVRREAACRDELVSSPVLSISTPSFDPPQLLASYSQDLLGDARNKLNILSALHVRTIESTSAALKAHEQSREQISYLRGRLRAVAGEVLEHLGDASHCPLCGTEHSEQYLASVLSGGDEADADEVDHLLFAQHKTATDERAKVDEAIHYLDVLETLEIFRNTEPTVSEALSRVVKELAILDANKQLFFKIQEELKSLEEIGLSKAGLSTGLAEAGLDYPPTKTELAELLVGLEDMDGLTEALNIAREQLDQNGVEFAKLLMEEATPEVRTFEELDRWLQDSVSRHRLAANARRSLSSMVSGDIAVSVDAIDGQLQKAADIALKLDASQKGEADRVEYIRIEREGAADSRDKLSSVEGKLSRLRQADSLLNQVVMEDSPQELTDRVLSENAERIHRIFASIHYPNEFDLQSVAGKLQIIRRRTMESCEIESMSTGQRAAYALSLFMAMNLRLSSGPPIMMFDDPVAHIDDINILSFLDHLRDLAVSGGRQIFFATADAKVAGLFRQKFKFMGSDRYKEINLVRAL